MFDRGVKSPPLVSTYPDFPILLSTSSGRRSYSTSRVTDPVNDSCRYASSSSGRAPNPPRRRRCSTCGSKMKEAIGRPSDSSDVGRARQEFRLQPTPGQMSCETRNAAKHPPPKRGITQPTDSKIENQPRQLWFLRRAVDHVGNSAAIRKQISLNQYGIAELCADFALHRALIAA